jgi:glycosyltransferase involved in cell wall biosynthesis
MMDQRLYDNPVMHVEEEKEFPSISIVICTLNRKRLLQDCLDSILRMSYPKSLYEIIVVDGGSVDGTKELCLSLSGVRFVIEKKFGLAYARNRGAELANGSIVAYTDDDCIVDTDWLENLVSAFRVAKSCIGVGGPVYAFNPKIVPKKISVNAALGLFYEGEMTKPVQCVLTSNAAFKRAIFNTVRFDENLRTTRRGKFILCGEDVDFCHTLVESGHTIMYTPHAKVYHQIRAERLRAWYIVQHAFGNGISTTIFILKKRNSRIWAVRVAVGMVIQSFWATIKERSFTSCYNLIMSLSTLLVSLTGLDRVVL